MSYEITYKSKWSGKTKTHKYEGTRDGAEGWGQYLAKDNKCKAVVTHVDRHDGKREHIVSYGDDSSPNDDQGN